MILGGTTFGAVELGGVLTLSVPVVVEDSRPAGGVIKKPFVYYPARPIRQDAIATASRCTGSLSVRRARVNTTEAARVSILPPRMRARGRMANVTAVVNPTPAELEALLLAL